MSKEKTHVDWDTMVHVQQMANLRAENTRLREIVATMVNMIEMGYPKAAAKQGRTALEAE